MFFLKNLKITENQHDVLSVDFISDRDVEECVFTTLVLGENGVGKSFLLKNITDIFDYLAKAQVYARKPKYAYDTFRVCYILDGHEYVVDRLDSRTITCHKDGCTVNISDIKIPNKILAVSFMVNDKFRFHKNEPNDRYVYLGVRQGTNSTYTGSIIRNVIHGITKIAERGKINDLQTILRLIKFDSSIEFLDRSGKIILAYNTGSNSSLTEDSIPQLSRTVSLRFYKNGSGIGFEDCSSGEKHIIFAFVSILANIEENSLVLIDEPEISLHPEWQIQYISLLKKVFKPFKGCHVLLASHSHYFVSDLEGSTSSIVILKHGDDGSFTPRAELLQEDTYAWSAENIIYNVFGLRTTRNYYFESDLRKLMQLMEAEDNKEKIPELVELIQKLKKLIFNSEDPLQIVISQAEEYVKCLERS